MGNYNKKESESRPVSTPQDKTQKIQEADLAILSLVRRAVLKRKHVKPHKSHTSYAEEFFASIQIF